MISIKRQQYVICTERSEKFSGNGVVIWFRRLYQSLGFEGASSHSGRRTAITRAAKKISLVGGSLRDVQMMAGHANLQTTMRYIESDSAAQRKIMNLIY